MDYVNGTQMALCKPTKGRAVEELAKTAAAAAQRRAADAASDDDKKAAITTRQMSC